MTLKSNLNSRQNVLVLLTAAFLLTAVIVNYYLLPLYDRFVSVRLIVNAKAHKEARLARNLKVREIVDEQFDKYGGQIEQAESDQIAMSNFLRGVETAARYPGMRIVNLKPLPVISEPTHQFLRVQVSVEGKLEDVIRLVSSTGRARTVTGLESFSLRGVQGTSRVECTLKMRTVRLMSQSRHGPHADSRQELLTRNGG